MWVIERDFGNGRTIPLAKWYKEAKKSFEVQLLPRVTNVVQAT